MLGAALSYAVNHDECLLDGRLELSNNRVERSVRPFAVGRKNWLFSNTPKGADASAAVYSIVETAKACGPYLKLLLELLPSETPAETCLPWIPSVQSLCK